MSINLNPVNESLFFSKKDPKDIRLGDLAKNSNVDQASGSNVLCAIVGYPDDDGIKLNGGRPGANLAPDQIRKYFYRMTPADSKTVPEKATILDFGNLNLESTQLPERHDFAQKHLQQSLGKKMKTFALGGGHDYGFPDAAAFVENNLAKNSLRPLIINFDAHLDVRPTDKGFHSGTPFFRLLEKYQGTIDFMEVGIQPQCNSVHHRAWAQDHGAVIMDLSSVERLGLLAALQANLESSSTNTALRPLWLSVDIDGFRNSEAPGCSQSFSTGLKIRDFLLALNYLVKYFDLQGMGIYEVSPGLDQDDRTSKLAALILYHTLFSH